MKSVIVLFTLIITVFICSCTNKTSDYKPPTEIYENVDYDSFVSIAGIDPEKAEHVMKLLDSNKIPNIVEGSVVYGVSVPPNKKEKAIELLKFDSKKYKYYIKF